MGHVCEDCGYYNPITDYCVLGKLETEEKLPPCYDYCDDIECDYCDDIECPDAVASVKDLIKDSNKSFSRKDYPGLSYDLESLADVLEHHGHRDLASLAYEIAGSALRLAGYDPWTGEFNQHIDEKERSRLEEEIFQGYKTLLREISEFFIL